MTDHELSVQALERAHAALAQAADDANIAAILAPPRSALSCDANVLADALDAEQTAFLATIERYA